MKTLVISLLVLFLAMQIFFECKAAEIQPLPSPTLEIPPPAPPQLIVPMYFSLDYADQWNAVNSILRDVNGPKELILIWSGFGGMSAMSVQFGSALIEAQRQGKNIHIHLVSQSDSAHAMAVCYTKNLSADSGAILMFHAGSYKRTFFFDQIEVTTYNLNVADRVQALIQDEVCRQNGYITDEDIKLMNKGYSINYVYMSSKERFRYVENQGIGYQLFGFSLRIFGIKIL